MCLCPTVDIHASQENLHINQITIHLNKNKINSYSSSIKYYFNKKVKIKKSCN